MLLNEAYFFEKLSGGNMVYVNYAVGIILGLIGVFGWVMFFKKLMEFKKILAYGGRTNAEVAANKEEIIEAGSNSAVYYSPVLEYRVNNVLYRSAYKRMSSPAKYKIGSTIRIRYDRNDPSKYENENLSDLFFQMAGMLVVGAGMFAFIYFMFF